MYQLLRPTRTVWRWDSSKGRISLKKSKTEPYRKIYSRIHKSRITKHELNILDDAENLYRCKYMHGMVYLLELYTRRE